jgi:hypothetical protein
LINEEKLRCDGGVYEGGEKERIERMGDGSEKEKGWKEETKQPRTALRPYSPRSDNPFA